MQPVVIFRHHGATPEQTVMMTLTRDGSASERLAVSAAGAIVGLSERFDLKVWHAVTITYGAHVPAGRETYPLKLYVDGRFQFEYDLPLGAPSGDVNFGIASPTSTAFVIAFDDYVETGVYDAPIQWARVNYLMPLGNGGAEGWQKAYSPPACANAASNWQLVSEDQSVTVPDLGNGQPGKCELGGGVTTTESGVVDLYLTEGIPSRHVASPGYKREILLQPTSSSTVLGARLRLRGISGGAPQSWSLGFIDQGILVQEEFTFSDGGTGGAQTVWGSTHRLRPTGQSWNASALNGVKLRLQSGNGIGTPRSTSGVRLDYVWTP